MADPNVAVAATFIASVMEHAGYLTQARFLHDFQGFFRDAGALIYAIAGAGAVVAVTMYGSTRAVQYLLIGPALFWFLVGPTTKSEGVRWKLGGGEYLGMFKEQGEQASEEFQKNVLKKMAEGGEKGGADIDVAIGFWLFAKPINDFVNEFVDIILDKESGEDLTAQAKIQGLELIGTMLPYDADHVQHLEEFANQCHQYFGAANSAAEVRARLRGRDAAINNGANVKADSVNEAYNSFKARAVEKGDSQTIDAVSSGYLELIRWMSGTSSDEPKGQAAITLAKQLKPQVENGVPIKCKDAWTLIAAETWFKAKAQIPYILNTSSGYWKYQSAREYTCEELTRKTLDDEEAGCDLAPAVTMFMLYNHWKSQDTYQRLIGRHRNGKDFTNPKATTVVTGPMARGFEAVTLTGQDGNIQSVRKQGFNAQGQPYLMQYMYNPNDVGKIGFDDKVRYQWMPIAPLTELRGMDHAMNVASRQFDTTRLKQQLISYAFQLPYYQGVALYMVAIAYPFLALIVLLPGRAHNFMAVPMAWLWLKSWDIGFAVVIVLDKIMYNLLPNWTLGQKLRDGPWTSTDELIEVMAQGFFFDPWGSIHNYYAIMAMATLSIPALTGLATLKAKKGVLSSFTDGAAAQAKNRADKAASGFSVQAQSERNHMMMQVKGLALTMAHGGDGKVDQGGRGRAAAFHAAMQTATTAAQKVDFKALSQGDITKLPGTAMETAQSYLESYKKGIDGYAPFAGELHARWDRNIGRAGVIQHMEEAYAAAMDAGGVYEMSGIAESPIDKMLGLMAGQADARIAAGGKGFKIGGKAVGDFMSDPIAGGLMAATAVAFEKELNGPNGLDDLRKATGAEGMTNEEFLRVTFYMDRFTYDTPALQAQLEKLGSGIAVDKDGKPVSLVIDDKNGKYVLPGGAHFKESVSGQLMLDVYNVLKGTDVNSRGGPSFLVDLDLDTMAPDRFLGNAPNKVQANLDAAVPRVDMDNVNALIDSAERKVSEAMGFAPKAQHSPIEIQTAEGLQLYANMMAQRAENINARFAQNHFIGGVVPDYAAEQVSKLQTDIIGLVGGADGLVTYWNSNANLSGRQLSFVDGAFKFSNGDEFGTADLIKFVQEKASDKKEKDSYYARMEENYRADDGVIDMFDTLQIQAMSGFQELPKFRHEGKEIGLVQLLEHDKLTTLQIARDWAAHNAGVLEGDISGIVPASNLMTSPGGYFKK